MAGDHAGVPVGREDDDAMYGLTKDRVYEDSSKIHEQTTVGV